MYRAMLIAVSAAALAGCAYLQDIYSQNPDYGSGSDPYEKIQFAGAEATAAERAQCEAAGGAIRPDGRRGWEHCVQTFPDAGKACSDSDECTGECRAPLGEDGPDAGEPVMGTCQVNDSPFGCHAAVEEGMATATICVD